jgi:stage II sporulation protein D
MSAYAGARLVCRIALLLGLMGLAAVLHAQAPDIRVRLFWRSVPEAVEIAPVRPFVAGEAPRMKLPGGREAWLRAPLRIAIREGALELGTRYPSRAATLQVNGAVRLRVPGNAWGSLAGSLRFWVHEGELEVEATLPREDYVKAVLAGEGGGIAEPEALRALAVAIRSYAFTHADRHKAEGFHFCDTTHCQDLRLTPRSEAVNRAVDDTADELLWHRGAPVPAYHHADSGGHTESAHAVWGEDAPAWMMGHADPHSLKPQPHLWRATLRKAEIAKALRAEGLAREDIREITVARRTASGRAALLRVGSRELPAADFRFAIGRQLGWQHLPSDLYEIQDQGDRLRFEGKGNGHGVGLSQNGAAAMARAGSGYREILTFYFPGTTVGISAQGIRWTLYRGSRLHFYFAEGARDLAFAAQAEAALRQVEAASGLRFHRDVAVRVYPDLDLYRNASGLGGDIAAGARAREIHLQPIAELRRQGDLGATLRHELAHALLLQHEARPLPEWLHEALARWMSGQPLRPGNGAKACGATPSFDALEARMHTAEGRRDVAVVADRFLRAALARYGRGNALGWARTGFPAENDQALTRLLSEACQQR